MSLGKLVNILSFSFTIIQTAKKRNAAVSMESTVQKQGIVSCYLGAYYAFEKLSLCLS